jgi:hypothetical protein
MIFGKALPSQASGACMGASESGILLIRRRDTSEASRWMLRDLPTRPGSAAALPVAETVDG